MNDPKNPEKIASDDIGRGAFLMALEKKGDV